MRTKAVALWAWVLIAAIAAGCGGMTTTDAGPSGDAAIDSARTDGAHSDGDAMDAGSDAMDAMGGGSDAMDTMGGGPDVIVDDAPDARIRDAGPGDACTVNVAPPHACGSDPAVVGDTYPCTQALFPSDTFYTPGGTGRIIDVTRPPFNARGDGCTDDTAALRAAYTFVLDQIDAVGWNNFFPNTPQPSYVIYLPRGTYLVHDPIIYNGPVRPLAGTPDERLVWIRIVGESRENTIVRLVDHAPHYQSATSPLPVISFGMTDFNNAPASNSLRNLTVSVGNGNPGAIGVNFGGANSSDVQNVTIQSEDGQGVVGLENSIGTLLSYQRDITIDGFDIGVRMVPFHFTHPTLEHVSLRNQHTAGVQLVDGTAVLRAVRSDNAVPSLLLSSGGAHAVMIDSTLAGTAGSARNAAVRIDNGHFFGRNDTVTGYGAGVARGTTTAVPGTIDEFVSDPIVRFNAAAPTHSMRLSIEEVPRFTWDPPTTMTPWARPASGGDGATDASVQVQAAMNSGRSTVYFPGYDYQLGTTVTIPCTVHRVEGLFSNISGGAGVKFRVLNCPTPQPPLLIEDLTFDGVAVENMGTRQLVLMRVQTQGIPYRNSAPTTGPRPVVHIIAGTGIKAAEPFQNVTAFIRTGNGESPAGQLVCLQSDIWVLGFKSEKPGTVFDVRGGCRLEVLGSLYNQYPTTAGVWDSSVAILNQGGRVSITGATNGLSTTSGFETIVRDTQAGTTLTLPYTAPQWPSRGSHPHQEIVPLYLSY